MQLRELLREAPAYGAIQPATQELLSTLLQPDPHRRLSWEEFFAHPLVHPKPILQFVNPFKSTDSASPSASLVASTSTMSGLAAALIEHSITEAAPSSLTESMLTNLLDTSHLRAAALQKAALYYFRRGLPAESAVVSVALLDLLNSSLASVQSYTMRHPESQRISDLVQVVRQDFITAYDHLALCRGQVHENDPVLVLEHLLYHYVCDQGREGADREFMEAADLAVDHYQTAVDILDHLLSEAPSHHLKPILENLRQLMASRLAAIT